MTNLHTIVSMELKLLVFSLREKLVQELRWPRKEVTINKSCSWVVKPREIDFFSSFSYFYLARERRRSLWTRRDDQPPCNEASTR